MFRQGLKLIKNAGLIKRGSLIGDTWHCDTGATITVDDPATLQPLTEVATVKASGVEEAIEAAHKAFPTWSQAKNRPQLLSRWAQLIEENESDLATLLCLENGKPIAEAHREIKSSASFFRYYAQLSLNEDRLVNSSLKHLVRQVPIGPVAVITPWNFSSSMLARKLAPALAAGCTVVAKPASETPLSGLALLALGREAGIPTGVINGVCVRDAPMAGKILSSHPHIRKLSFTGSTRTGSLLMAQAANNLTKLGIELGGHAAMLVLPEAILDRAVEGVIASRFRNAGQTCISVNRVFIPEHLYDEFKEQLRQKLEGSIVIGHGLDPKTTLGPLISPNAKESLMSRLTSDLRVEEIGVSLPDHLPGAFMKPILVDIPPLDHEIAKEEVFGPCLLLHPYNNLDRTIEHINSSRYGLAAYVYGDDAMEGWRVAERLQVGMVGVNETNGISTCEAPFGGCKHSGWGREGSREGLAEYQYTQTITIGSSLEAAYKDG